MKNKNMVIDIATGKLVHWGPADFTALIQPGQEQQACPVEELPGPIQDCYFDKGKILYLPTDAEKIQAGKLTQAEADDKEVERLIAEEKAKILDEERTQQAIESLKVKGLLDSKGKIKRV